MEEEKKKVNGENPCNNCPFYHCGLCSGCGFRRHFMMRKILWVVLLIIVFCLGVQYGELKSEARGFRSYRGEMMNWGYKNVKPLINNVAPENPTTPVPPVTTQ